MHRFHWVDAMVREATSSVAELREACAELERRLATDKSYGAESVFASHPALSEDADAALEVIYTEYVAREQSGLSPTAEQFYARFPRWRDGLEQLFEIHRAAGGVSVVGPSATPSPERIPSLAAAGSPRRVGNYEILAELGRGGMGVVYKARQVGLNRLVALKMILTGADAGPKERARFRAEAEAAARLQHPNIVQIYEVGEHEGRPFLSMELVDGGSLEEYLAGQPCLAGDAARLVETLARAMQHAHEHGVVHRDLKPGNILLVSGGMVSGESSKASTTHHSPLTTHQPKITDFGLARRLAAGPEAQTALTAAGAVVGTPAYMAPEQAAGEGREAGPAADVYSLGAILYELLTGRPPFRGVGMLETLEQVRTQEPVSPGRLMPGLPRDIETTCLKCLQKEPGRRYASAAELADDLARFRSGEPIRARPVGALERARKWARRRPAVAALLAVLVVLTVVSITTVALLWRRTADALDHARSKQDETEAAAAERLIALAQRDWAANDLEAARRHLDECPPIHRDAEWRYLHRVCHSSLGVLPIEDPREPIATVAWSPDGRYVAASRATGVMVWDAATGEKRHHLREHTWRVSKLAFRSDGVLVSVAQVLFNGAGTPPEAHRRFEAKLWDLDTGREVQALTMTLPANRFALGSDGRRLISAGPGILTIVELRDGLESITLPAEPPVTRALALTADGTLLARSTDAPGVHVRDTRHNAMVGPIIPARSTQFLTFSPGGDRLAVAQFDGNGKIGTIELYDYRTARAGVVLRGHQAQINCLAFSPDGRRLASGSSDRTIIVWDLVTGTQQFVFRGHTAEVSKLAFNPNGTRLASASYDATVRIWDTDESH